MLNLTTLSTKREWRIPALVVFAAALFGAALVTTNVVSRQLNQVSRATASMSTSDVVPGGVSATDRQIGVLQDRLRQQPNDQKSATQLGLAYLQRARENSDPSYLTRADGILTDALTVPAEDPDTLIGLGTLALARHQFTDAVDWGQRAIASNEYKPGGFAVLG